ncbi:MAG: alpha-amylase [Lachnospiraceae bacterium]|nr:alpha-amylase [Lachnospiraceae bacterium]
MKRNKTMMQYFEWYLPANRSLWKRVAKDAVSLSEHGITSVWLPPAYKGAGGVKDVGYAVYDLYDLGEFNQKNTISTKYGTKDEYLDAVRELQKNNIEVLADIVLGHRMGADEKERIFAYGQDVMDRNREIEGKRKITVWTKFTFPGRNNKYSDFKWDWTNFHATDYDAKSKESGIYRFIGKEWDNDVDGEFGNYDYLMGVDLDMSDPEVLEELDRWGKWYYDFTGVDGFRLDAVKHIDFSFFKVWLGKIREYSGKDIFAVGEYWNAELSILENYIEKSERALSLFDVPLHFNMHYASISNGYYDMRYILKNTLVGKEPELAVTFVDNHDTQPGQALESWILEWFKPHAYSIILLRDTGYPCVFFGDYYGIPHNKFEPVKSLERLIELRRDNAYGRQHDYFNNRSIVGWTREGVEEMPESGLAVIMTVSTGGTKKMYVGIHYAGCTFYDALGNVEDKVEVDDKGFGIFEVKDGSVSVYIPDLGSVAGDYDETYNDPKEVGALDEVNDSYESEDEPEDKPEDNISDEDDSDDNKGEQN